MSDIFTIIFLLILVFVSGFFSASETALTSYKYIDYIESKKKHMHRNKMARMNYWIKHPNKILTGILIGNNLANTFATAIFTVFLNILINKKLHLSTAKSVILTTIIMTTVLLLFSEITPKVFAKKHYHGVSELVITPIYFFTIISTPIIWLFVNSSKIILILFGVKLSQNTALITENEIRSMVLVGEEEGIIEKDEKEMINSIFEFGDTTAQEVMIPRSQVFAIDTDNDMADNLAKIQKNGYSRIPVYTDNLDKIIGILHVKDMLAVMSQDDSKINIKSLLKNAYYIPENMNLMMLLNEFKKRRLHFAIVVDEYGTTAGVVTLEDLLEEIVGEIEDEHDELSTLINKISENTYIIDPIIAIDVLNEKLNLDLPEKEDYNTLSGYLLNSLERIPEKNEDVLFDQFKVKILSIKNHRIAQVKLSMLDLTSGPHTSHGLEDINHA